MGSHNSLESLASEQDNTAGITDPALSIKARDGACHEMVMWYIHHLSESAREEIKERLTLPLLPEVKHEEPTSPSDTEVEVHRRYTQQASCAVCHVNPTKAIVV